MIANVKESKNKTKHKNQKGVRAFVLLHWF